MVGDEEVEVNLVDYLNVLWKRKALIVSLVLLSAASAGLFSFLVKPTYEVSRILKIGQIGQVTEIDTREAVIEMLSDQRFLEEVRAKVGAGIPIEQFAKRVVVNRRSRPQAQDSTHVRYTVEAESPAEAVTVADAIADSVIQRHAKVFAEGMAVKERYEEDLKREIDLLSNEIYGIRKTFEDMRPSPRLDASVVILLQTILGDRERSLADLKRELRDLQISNSPVMSGNTRVLSADAPPTRPVRPKRAQNVLLAAAVSLFASVFLAFFLEYWERVTRERREGARPATT